MRFISTKSNSAPVGIDEAVNRCVAADGGMFMPETMPRIPKAFFNNIGEMNLRDIAFVVANSFLGQEIDGSALKAIVDESFAFDAPLRRLDGTNNYFLELFNGPTLTFKDYGARFMARLIRHLDRRARRHRNILVATTGNTGAAAANGLFKLDGVSVSVLYPKGQLSKSQTSQITSLGENIHAVEILGTVEDCKRLVQTAMADPAFAEYNLTGANSINIARLIPQISFALHAYARLKAMGVEGAENALYSIPSGNMSNVVATAMAKACGLPMGAIIAAVNANDQVAPLMQGTPVDAKRKPLHTLAPSLDMAIPSGWPRLELLYGGDLRAMNNDIICAAPVSDDVIASTMNGLSRDMGYTIDPHGAVAFAAAAAEGNAKTPQVIFATGHPAKQLDIMTRCTGRAVELPVQLTRFMSVKRHATVLPPTLPALRKHLSSIQ